MTAIIYNIFQEKQNDRANTAHNLLEVARSAILSHGHCGWELNKECQEGLSTLIDLVQALIDDEQTARFAAE